MNEEEIGKLPKTEFTIMIVKMIILEKIVKMISLKTKWRKYKNQLTKTRRIKK